MMLELIVQDVKPRSSFYRNVKMAFLVARLKGGLRKKFFRSHKGWLVLTFLLTSGLFGSVATRKDDWVGKGGFELPAESEVETLFLSIASEPMDKNTPFQPPTVQDFPELTLKTYRIKPGETLLEVARKHGIRLDTLISMNEITDARKVPAGSELIIPNKDGILYKVNRGDSLYRIGSQFNTQVRNLIDANDLSSELIHPGMKLFVPGAKLPEMELRRILGELFIFPTTGRITSAFGIRSDPFTGVRRFHNGVDIANDMGTPVHAAQAGTVAKIGVHPSYGKYVILTHTGGYQTFYAHLHSVAVNQGKSVAQGEILGEMGNTGYSTGPHLHFSVFKNGNPVDPMQFFR